jgi:hypothetical protein
MLSVLIITVTNVGLFGRVKLIAPELQIQLLLHLSVKALKI